MIAWLDARGAGYDSTIMAYPQGAYNDEVISVMTARGVNFARTLPVDGYVDESHRLGYANPLALVCIIFASAVPGFQLADVMAAIDKAEALGTTLIILHHRLVTSGVVGNDTLLSEFQTVMNYIVAKRDAGTVDTKLLSEIRRAT